MALPSVRPVEKTKAMRQPNQYRHSDVAYSKRSYRYSDQNQSHQITSHSEQKASLRLPEDN